MDTLGKRRFHRNIQAIAPTSARNARTQIAPTNVGVLRRGACLAGIGSNHPARVQKNTVREAIGTTAVRENTACQNTPTQSSDNLPRLTSVRAAALCGRRHIPSALDCFRCAASRISSAMTRALGASLHLRIDPLALSFLGLGGTGCGGSDPPGASPILAPCPPWCSSSC